GGEPVEPREERRVAHERRGVRGGGGDEDLGAGLGARADRVERLTLGAGQPVAGGRGLLEMAPQGGGQKPQPRRLRAPQGVAGGMPARNASQAVRASHSSRSPSTRAAP